MALVFAEKRRNFVDCFTFNVSSGLLFVILPEMRLIQSIRYIATMFALNFCLLVFVCLCFDISRPLCPRQQVRDYITYLILFFVFDPFWHPFVCTYTIEPPLGIPLLYATFSSHLSHQLRTNKTRCTKESTSATN